MVLSSCLIQLAAMVVTFNGQNSLVNITSPALSDVISSMVLQFRTTQQNSQIAAMMSGNQSFAVNIRNKFLKLDYNFNETGNGSINVGMVSPNTWFLLNITSSDSSTRINLSVSDDSISTSCVPKFTTRKITLLGQEFSDLLKTSALQIGGPTNDKSLKSFKGCIGLLTLNNNVIDLLNMSKDSQPFKRNIMGVSKRCECGSNQPCDKGVYIWDETKGKCGCTCSVGYHGQFCNRTITKVSDDGDVDPEFLYIVVGVTVGILLLVILIVCVVVYIKRTSSSVFGVYNPKSQEQIQGQQMNMAFTLPIPEKLI